MRVFFSFFLFLLFLKHFTRPHRPRRRLRRRPVIPAAGSFVVVVAAAPELVDGFVATAEVGVDSVDLVGSLCLAEYSCTLACSQSFPTIDKKTDLVIRI